jgi:hypothetical protein
MGFFASMVMGAGLVVGAFFGVILLIAIGAVIAKIAE